MQPTPALTGGCVSRWGMLGKVQGKGGKYGGQSQHSLCGLARSHLQAWALLLSTLTMLLLAAPLAFW